MKNQQIMSKFITRTTLLTIVFTICLTLCAFASDGDTALQANAHKFGILTLLPPLVAIVLSFVTKNVIISLFLGLFAGALILNFSGLNIFVALYGAFQTTISTLLSSLASPWNAGIILQCLTIGGLIAVISKTGGTKAVANYLARKSKSSRSSQIVTFTLGILVFFDDYANSLIVGPIMRPVTDKMRVSREKLSFIVDATAAPIAGIALISTWIGLELSLIKDGFESIGFTQNAYSTFLSTIPYRYYNILILIFIVFTAILLREFGPMRKAEERARTTGETLRKDSQPLASEESDLEPKSDVKLRMINAILPIMILIVASFLGFYFNGYKSIMADPTNEFYNLMASRPLSLEALQATFGASDASIVIFAAAMLASIVSIIMACFQKILKLDEAIETWVKGVKSLIITAVILLLAWSIGAIIKELGTAFYLVDIIKESALPAFLLPSIIFILSALISFATGTSYGTMSILMPLTIPIAFALNNDYSFVVLSISSVLTGSIVGDHCSPISDTTILSSMGCGCDHLDHVKTQFTYVMVVSFVSIVAGYIPSGLGIPVYITLPSAILVIFLIVRFIGKPVSQYVYIENETNNI